METILFHQQASMRHNRILFVYRIRMWDTFSAGATGQEYTQTIPELPFSFHAAPFSVCVQNGILDCLAEKCIEEPGNHVMKIWLVAPQCYTVCISSSIIKVEVTFAKKKKSTDNTTDIAFGFVDHILLFVNKNKCMYESMNELMN